MDWLRSIRLSFRLYLAHKVEGWFGVNPQTPRNIKMVMKSELRRHFKTDIPDSIIENTFGHLFASYILIKKPRQHFTIQKKIKRLLKFDKKEVKKLEKQLEKSDAEKLGLNTEMPTLEEEQR